MHNYWAICACLQYKTGEVLDKSKPFNTYNIEAADEKKAVEKLKNMFPQCEVIMYGDPVHATMTDKEYENV